MGCTSKDFSSCSAFLRLLVALMVAHRPRSRLYRRLFDLSKRWSAVALAPPEPGRHLAHASRPLTRLR